MSHLKPKLIILKKEFKYRTRKTSKNKTRLLKNRKVSKVLTRENRVTQTNIIDKISENIKIVDSLKYKL